MMESTPRTLDSSQILIIIGDVLVLAANHGALIRPQRAESVRNGERT